MKENSGKIPNAAFFYNLITNEFVQDDWAG